MNINKPQVNISIKTNARLGYELSTFDDGQR